MKLPKEIVKQIVDAAFPDATPEYGVHQYTKSITVSALNLEKDVLLVPNNRAKVVLPNCTDCPKRGNETVRKFAVSSSVTATRCSHCGATVNRLGESE